MISSWRRRMHELSVCQALIEQVQRLAREHRALRVDRIVLQIGPLAGIEPELLKHAYPVAAAGTLAEGADLVFEARPVTVHCRDCGGDSEALPNRLLCAHCGSFRTELTGGDEMLLASLEFLQADA